MNNKIKEMILKYHQNNPKTSANQLSKMFGVSFIDVCDLLIPKYGALCLFENNEWHNYIK